jgi:hypothetical protein
MGTDEHGCGRKQAHDNSTGLNQSFIRGLNLCFYLLEIASWHRMEMRVDPEHI